MRANELRLCLVVISGLTKSCSVGRHEKKLKLKVSLGLDAVVTMMGGM